MLNTLPYLIYLPIWAKRVFPSLVGLCVTWLTDTFVRPQGRQGTSVPEEVLSQTDGDTGSGSELGK